LCLILRRFLGAVDGENIPPYSVNDRQYVTVAAGIAMFVFALKQ
jgi:hypothetical protein